MVSMQVAQTDEVEVLEFRARLAETQEGAAAGVDQDPGLAVAPEHVAGRGPPVVRDRTA